MDPNDDKTFTYICRIGDELDLLGFDLTTVEDDSGVLTFSIQKRLHPGFIQGDEAYSPVKPRRSWSDRLRRLLR